MSHLEKNGFKVEKKVVFGKGFTDLKRKHGVPEKLFACHTATIEGYIIEGHVPADLIYKLLKEKPQVLGLAVPGMPVGSPGMEGGKPEPYEVLTFDKHGRTTVYATRSYSSCSSALVRRPCKARIGSTGNGSKSKPGRARWRTNSARGNGSSTPGRGSPTLP